MSTTRDIVATYRGPGRVIRRLLAMGPREDRALAYVMGACVVVFVAQWPRLAREAHLTGQDLNPMLGGTLLAWVFMAPLILYTLALVTYWIAKVLGANGAPYHARLALFWALLSSTPLLLLHGLIAGFVGPGPGLQLVGIVWFAVFAWFWSRGFISAMWSK